MKLKWLSTGEVGGGVEDKKQEVNKYKLRLKCLLKENAVNISLKLSIVGVDLISSGLYSTV